MDMSAPSSSKSVLVHFQDQRRHVTFSSGNITTNSLICAFKETFAAALGEKESTPLDHEVLLQMKNGDWGGEYVDIQGDSSRSNCSQSLVG